MISVCVPIYNYDVTALAAELSRQSNLLSDKIEIIFIDDASEESFKSVNQHSCAQDTYIESNKNLGRSKIRNLFIKYARFPYLLFLDCDSDIISDNFLRNYLDQLSEKELVICGGTVYPDLPPPRKQLLRWKYGRETEARSAAVRTLNPANYFNANNFLVSQSILIKYPFNESIQDYGHEDTLFAYELKRHQINILHIDNPVLHAGIDTNLVFLEKTEQSILNLSQILQMKGTDANFAEYVRLLRAYHRLQNSGLSRLYTMLFTISKPIVRNLLLKGIGSKHWFAFYKLGIFLNYAGKLNQDNP